MNGGESSRLSAGRSGPLVCSNCRRLHPAEGFLYRCPACGGLFDFAAPILYDPEWKTGSRRRGLGRFRSLFPLPAEAPFISLGEGGTPLIEGWAGNRAVHFKCEQLNPTGSFKDRGAAVLVSALAAAGVRRVVEDSSGNAGAALAAYAAQGGIQARVFAPASASGPKLAQMEAYGAEVIRVPGPRSAVSEEVQRAAGGDVIYASHAHLPDVLIGTATMAFELVEQLGQAPGSVVSPAGQGSILLGLYRGFQALVAGGVIERLPQLVGVQARACAPLWAVHAAGAAGLRMVSEGATVAEGIRILRPLRGDAVLAAVEASDGTWVAVDEDPIEVGRQALARQGLYVEPTSAVVWPALIELGESLHRPIVAVLTGSGFKAGLRPEA